MVKQYGLTPAEAVDFYAVALEGYTQREWSDERGLEGHQSVGRNVREARKKLDPRNIIDTVVVDPNDVIEALRFNSQPRDYTNQRSAVIRINPPFQSESTASIYYSEEGNHYPPEMDPQPIHINPRVFVDDPAVDIPIRGDERARAREELDDPTDDDIEEFVAQAFEVWEDHARKALVDETDINDSERSHGDKHVVSIKYE